MLSIFSLSGRILQAPAYYKLESPRPKTATKIDLHWITVLLMHSFRRNCPSYNWFLRRLWRDWWCNVVWYPKR